MKIKLLSYYSLQQSKKSSENNTLLQVNSNGVIRRMENGTNENNTLLHNKTEELEKKSHNEYIKKIKETFDLDLLKSGVYLNVIVGLSLYYVAESNFKLMTPFFLTSIGK